MSFPLAIADVYRVARGYNADGSRRVGRPLSFPTREETLTAVATQVHTLYCLIAAERPDILQDAPKRTALVFKLMAHLTRSGRVRPHLIESSADEVAMAGVILAEQPHLISEPVSFASIVARYEHFLIACKRLRPSLTLTSLTKPDHVPDRPVLWRSAEGEYLLHELVHPWHLAQETEALCHCIGKPQGMSWTPSTDLCQLPYWTLISSGRSRVFSFGFPHMPLCTLHARVDPALLSEIQGRLGQPYIVPALFQALHHLRTLFPRLTLDRELPLRLIGTLGLTGTTQFLAALKHDFTNPPQ